MAADFRIVSSAFENGGEIPSKYTCEGEDASPALQWSGVPANAKSLALLVDDPDAPDPKAPKMTFTHWLLYDLPPTDGALPEAAGDDALPAGTRQGLNDVKRTGWTGPCPPIGRHRYFFHLYALDTVLGDRGTLTRAALLEAIDKHVIAKAETLGTYEKQRR